MTDELTPDLTPKKAWIPGFLVALAEYGNVSKAAKKAKVSRPVIYEERSTNPEFAGAWARALKIGTDALEDEARRRAFEGVKRTKGIYYLGEEIGHETIVEYSDTLMIFLLKAHKPELYRETSRNYNLDLSSCTVDQLERIAAGEDPVKVLAS